MHSCGLKCLLQLKGPSLPSRAESQSLMLAGLIHSACHRHPTHSGVNSPPTPLPGLNWGDPGITRGHTLHIIVLRNIQPVSTCACCFHLLTQGPFHLSAPTLDAFKYQVHTAQSDQRGSGLVAKDVIITPAHRLAWSAAITLYLVFLSSSVCLFIFMPSIF